MVAHLKQEHFHAIWKILLDDAFIEAHKNGLDIVCGDGIRRQEFLRIFTYATDYPERYAILHYKLLVILIISRTMVACIRNLGNHGCPQDLIHKSQYDLLGVAISRAFVRVGRRTDDITHRELVSSARNLIYQQGAAVHSTAVEAMLFPESLVPTSVRNNLLLLTHSNLFPERIF